MRTSLGRIVPLLAALVAGLPATAGAQESTSPSGGAPAPSAAPPPFALSAGGNAMLGRVVRFRGAVDARLAGRAVVVQAFDPRAGAWVAQARTRVTGDGKFLARWRPRHTGRFSTRAIVRGEASSAAASPELPLTVFRPAVATWYGPGFHGNTTACGLEMTPELVGVAHRRLPCGTNVAVRYGGRTLVLPVVDRGPFGGVARWDLTEGAAKELGFTHTDRIGAVPVAEPPQASR